jgi:hypothetical protein
MNTDGKPPSAHKHRDPNITPTFVAKISRFKMGFSTASTSKLSGAAKLRPAPQERTLMIG